MDGSPQPPKKTNLTHIPPVELGPAIERRGVFFLLDNLFFSKT